MFDRQLQATLSFFNRISASGPLLKRGMQDRLTEYTNDESLGRDFDLLLTVKNAKQKALNRVMRDRLLDPKPRKVLGGRYARPYREGLLVHVEGDTQMMWETAMKEPFGIDLRGKLLVVCSGNEVHLFDLNAEVLTIFSYHWFAQLHSVHFSPDGQRLLVASTGFDSIIEFSIATCELTWFWCAWEHGYDRSPTGAKFVCRADGITRYGRNERLNAIGDPATWGGFGIPGGLAATHVNNAQYQDDNKILVTLFHQGKAVAFDRHTHRASVVLGGLLNPHGFEPAWGGEKVVTDTRRGCVVFLDENFNVKRILKIDAAPPVDGREALSEWLQNVLPLRDGLYGAIDIHRSCIWIIDVEHRRYRRISFRSDWSVQNLVAVDTETNGKLNNRLEKFKRVHQALSGSMGCLSQGAEQFVTSRRAGRITATPEADVAVRQVIGV